MTEEQRNRQFWLEAAFIFAAWTVFGLMLANQGYMLSELRGQPMPWRHALRHGLFDAYLWAFATLAIFWLARHFPLERGRMRRSIAVHLVAAVFLSLARIVVMVELGRQVEWLGERTYSRQFVPSESAFFGANPAEVRRGSRQGLRALADEEDIGRELVLSLDERQRADALIAARTPRDIVTGNAARVEPLSPVGIRVTDLRTEQIAILVRLLEVYLGRMAEPLAAQRRAALERTDFNEVAFAWAGSTRPGEAHYYRIQGPSFLVEYDNTQNNANHIHTVWRDFDGDFGRDLLREHYRNAAHPH
jgi:hypothetical protein